MLLLFTCHLLRMSSENFIFPDKTCSDSVLARQASSLHTKSELSGTLHEHPRDTTCAWHSDCWANMPEFKQARQESFLVANTKTGQGSCRLNCLLQATASLKWLLTLWRIWIGSLLASACSCHHCRSFWAEHQWWPHPQSMICQKQSSCHRTSAQAHWATCWGVPVWRHHCCKQTGDWLHYLQCHAGLLGLKVWANKVHVLSTLSTEFLQSRRNVFVGALLTMQLHLMLLLSHSNKLHGVPKKTQTRFSGKLQMCQHCNTMWDTAASCITKLGGQLNIAPNAIDNGQSKVLTLTPSPRTLASTLSWNVSYTICAMSLPSLPSDRSRTNSIQTWRHSMLYSLANFFCRSKTAAHSKLLKRAYESTQMCLRVCVKWVISLSGWLSTTGVQQDLI